MYKLHKIEDDVINSVSTTNGNIFISIPLTDPANTDYANFKNEILNDQAELQDTEGVVMTPEAAKEFVRTLP